ncbi:MAG TPA: UDP-N-acetylmuramoyl-L-alanyl-D-glutamate--2,6-diaminopimelate ligase [Lautropia sp.]|nr:UDP-N-acetylmuramoyl-L-alanyl-D-glutamate--2,6-diaminopimelate ligase [Lautropia sp.]
MSSSVISPVARQAADWLKAQLPVRARLTTDSRTIGEGDVFLAYPGDTGDGRAHIASALTAGAAAIVLEQTGAERFDGPLRQVATPSLRIEGLRRRVGEVAAAYLGEPSADLTVVAVTGTNGKTSCTHWIAEGCNTRGRTRTGADVGAAVALEVEARAAVIGTLGAGFPSELGRGAGRGRVGPSAAGPSAAGTSAAGTSAADTTSIAAPSRPPLTTPDAVDLQQQLAAFADQGVELVALEASSIGLQQGRLNGTRIGVAVMTNLTRDHLDYHVTMQAYAAAKAKLFSWPTLVAAVVNLEDPASTEMLNAADPELRRIGYLVNDVGFARSSATDPSSSSEGEEEGDFDLDSALADAGERSTACSDLLTATPIDDQGRIVLTHFQARQQSAGPFGGRMANPVDDRGADDGLDDADGEESGARSVDLQLSLIGRFNQSNILAVAGVWIALGWTLAEVAAQLEKLRPVPGRLQVVSGDPDLPLVVVDYAHTPDALVNALKALRPLSNRRNGRLWCVFGAGGDRDTGKRAPMAAAAEAHADLLVLTSDNPRSESPSAIIAQLRAGLRRAPHRVEEDRALAIAQTVQAADAADVVLIAGKGHESYQEIGQERLPFSDLDQARLALQARTGSGDSAGEGDGRDAGLSGRTPMRNGSAPGDAGV